MLQNTVRTPKKKKKWIIFGVIALIIIVAAINIFIMQGEKKGSVKTDSVSFEKVTERKF
ncbi:efflux transporter periplasmic adaptor subunit, partial [Bacillus sp. CH_50]